MKLSHFFRKPALSLTKKDSLLSIARQRISSGIKDVETEYCFNVETVSPLAEGELKVLRWLLAETFEPENFSDDSFLASNPPASPLEKGGDR
jgi:phosphoribosylformylglycinamidine synthase